MYTQVNVKNNGLTIIKMTKYGLCFVLFLVFLLMIKH